MSQKQTAIVRSLKRQHHLLWLLLGLGFSLWLCSQLSQNGATSIAILVGLLATYYAAGQWAARLIARSMLQREEPRQSAALMTSSLKIGAFASMLSILFRAAIFPFLACLGAACTASDSAWPEPAGMVGYPKNSGLPTPTD